VRTRERLCVELGEVKPSWDAWCARRGLTAGEGVRKLIVDAVNVRRDGQPVAIESGLSLPIAGEPRSRVEIRLTVAERAAVDLHAARLGLNSNRWVVALIRAQLTREPQLGERELLLLSASNQQLALISRSLAQLARSGGVPLICPSLADLLSVREQIGTHLRVVADVIRANLDRWGR
jgi:hypothetical protein